MQGRTSRGDANMATYGLATQLRTPPSETANLFAVSAPSAPTFSGYSVSKNLTPAMRDDEKLSPKLGSAGSGVPSWGPRTTRQPSRSAAGKRESATHGAGAGQGVGRDRRPRGEQQVSPRLHSRSISSSRVDPRSSSPKLGSWAPNRPPRPSSPPSHPLPVPPIPATILSSRAGGAGMQKSKSQHHVPTFSTVSQHAQTPLDFSFAPFGPLDLGIQMNGSYPTYQPAESSPSSNIGNPDPDDGYKAQVGVATRISRSVSMSNSGRNASVATIVSAPQPAPTASLPPLPKLERSRSSAGPSHIRPPRAPSPNGTSRPIGQGLRSSYSGSVAPPTVFRRSSSVYIPNPSAAPPPVVSAPSRLPQTLLSLARRTGHIATIPGYGWRLHLLEKVEAITGSHLTIQEAEEILSIGNGAEVKKTSNRSESRRSQIGLPAPSNRPRAPLKSPGGDKGGFFGKMKRGLFHEPPPAKVVSQPPPAKVVFGQPLSVVAGYGFVTSMIAGQRHDLPGVCFSTVEEIYRRGQGPRIPGLLTSSGEPGRVAKLTTIYDSAPDYGEHHDLSIESIHNITTLLKNYLRDLPEPVLDHRLWRLFLSSCVDSSASIKQRIACAQIILRLLPAANFSLLVYLIAFLSQAPLFPENKLTLESVSSIFGPATMAQRGPPSKLSKFVSGSMVISGPTENIYDSAVSSKKAQDGLLWLLTHWSSIADGLLEPDFDLDVDSVLGRTPPPAPVSTFAKPQPQIPTSVPKAVPSLTLPVPPIRAPASQESPTQEAVPSSTSTHEIPTPSIAPSQEVTSPSPTTASSPETLHVSTPSTNYSATSSITTLQGPMTPPKHFDAEFSSYNFENDASNEVAEVGGRAAESGSSRSSESTLDDSLSSDADIQTHAPLFHDAGGAKTKARLDGFPRAIPEDQYGPLEPLGTSVLDDLLEHDEQDYRHRSDPALFIFPTPPSEFGYSSGGRSEGIIVRSREEQLWEFQEVQEAQRREIQTLWKQLTDNELARAAERSEMDSLRQEMAALKSQRSPSVESSKDQVAISNMEARCREAKRSMEEALEQLRLVQEEKLLAEQEARIEITSLKAQLDSIRSVLGGVHTP